MSLKPAKTWNGSTWYAPIPFPKLVRGGGIAPKLFMRALDIQRRYRIAGRAWVDAGRPEDGPLREKFERMDAEYQPMADQVLWASMNEEQREQWNADIHTDDGKVVTT